MTRRHLDDLWQRFSYFPPPLSLKHPKRLWFHAASVGEIQAAKALITALHKQETRVDIVITTVTRQGHLAAKKQLANIAQCLYAPIDLPLIVDRFIAKLNPDVYICLETELWPNTLRLMQAKGVKTLLLNGRLSENAFRRYSIISGFMRQVVRCFNTTSVIHEIDRKRYIALGLEPDKIEVNGNAKYDQPIESFVPLFDHQDDLDRTSLQERVGNHFRNLLDLNKNHPVIIAGSTHSGEESMMIDTFIALSATIPDLVLVVAPRHIERIDQIESDWRSKNINFKRLSQARSSLQGQKIILVDQMGVLASLYSIGTYVFCGGSLVDRGGHNIMEPAMWGKPPFFGPHMSDFNDARSLLENQGAGFLVNNTEELITKILYFHLHQDSYQDASERALTVAAAQQGAATRQADLIRQALDD
ncbi:MAG: hypothetical protein KKD63_03150 [Proteobacteria bacterium]|nr:hypothetical protein [Pseudomonadota bacterium]